MTGELKSLNDKLDNISPNIDDLSGDANRKSEDSKISSSEANTGLADNTELLHQAQMLENDVDKAKEESDAKSATLSDMENKLDDKIDQVSNSCKTWDVYPLQLSLLWTHTASAVVNINNAHQIQCQFI